MGGKRALLCEVLGCWVRQQPCRVQTPCQREQPSGTPHLARTLRTKSAPLPLWNCLCLQGQPSTQGPSCLLSLRGNRGAAAARPLHLRYEWGAESATMRLSAIATGLGATIATVLDYASPLPAHARCAWSENGSSYICINRVTANRSTPHLNRVEATINGSPVYMVVDCSDFTFNTGSGWQRFRVGSHVHSVCSEWSF